MPRPNIVITSGDPAGIGPDIIAGIDVSQFAARLIVIGDFELIKNRCKAINSDLEFVTYLPDGRPAESTKIEILPIPLCEPCEAGILNQANAGYVLETLKRACNGCLTDEFDAMVTAPVQKNIINQAWSAT